MCILDRGPQRRRLGSILSEHCSSIKPILHSVQPYPEVQRELTVDPPICVLMGFLGLNGYRIVVRGGWDEGEPIDRELLELH